MVPGQSTVTPIFCGKRQGSFHCGRSSVLRPNALPQPLGDTHWAWGLMPTSEADPVLSLYVSKVLFHPVLDYCVFLGDTIPILYHDALIRRVRVLSWDW